MEKTDYEDFVLRIRKDSKGYIATPSGPAEVGPGPGEPFESPFQDGDLEELRTFRGSGSRDLDPQKKTAQSRTSELGQRLFETVFAGKIRRFWDTSRDRAQLRGHGLRLRLILESSELWDWPWEDLQVPNGDLLILAPDISIVRCPAALQPDPARYIEIPLRVVVVIAQPSGSDQLDCEQEFEELKGALADLEDSGFVELERVESASLANLAEGLEKPIHVLHFIGHGRFDRTLEQGFLHFEKRDGAPDPVSGLDLARVLRRQQPPALVVLNACEGGRAARADPFGGVAQALMRDGTLAVVAMRFPVADEAALAFSKAFYKALVRDVTVDQAVYEARHSLFAGRFGDWGNPVLYSRSLKGTIFEFSSPNPSTPWQRLVGVAGALLLVALSVGGYLLSHSRGISFMGPFRVSKGSSKGCPPIPDLEMVFKRIDPGTFTMGTEGAGADTMPHKVTITKPFCMSETEITRLQWERVMGEDPSKNKSGPDLPVEFVSWNHVQDFLQAIQSRAANAKFRLPTEAQWEYGAKAKSTTVYSFGDDIARLSLYANCSKIDDHFDVTAPVGTFAPNDWGLYDMQGNVSEWIADWYAPYELEPQTNPTGPLEGTQRVRRGGSFEITAVHCTPTWRTKSAPYYRKHDVGFRIVRDVKP